MEALAIIGAGFAIVAGLIFALVKLAGSAGKSAAREDAMRKGAERRAKFDEENSKPLDTDPRRLSDQLRDL